MTALKEQVVWVVGGGSGVGRATALELAGAGATVIVSGRRPERLQGVVDDPAANGRVIAAELDIADDAAVDRVAQDLLKQHGRVDTLVIAAGVGAKARAWSDVAAKDWKYVSGVNLNGAFYCIRSVLPSMRERRQGHVIAVGSWGGRYALKLNGPAYASSKRGMMAMMESLNMEEFQNGIRACMVVPAGINTELLNNRAVPFKQEELDVLMQPEDLARLIRFVAETPQHVVFNEILMSPIVNYMYQRSA